MAVYREGYPMAKILYFRVGFKPVPSVKIPQSTVNLQGEPAEITIAGRHDTCHVPRLVVVVESMAALVLADHLLRMQVSAKHKNSFQTPRNP